MKRDAFDSSLRCVQFKNLSGKNEHEREQEEQNLDDGEQNRAVKFPIAQRFIDERNVVVIEQLRAYIVFFHDVIIEQKARVRYFISFHRG